MFQRFRFLFLILLCFGILFPLGCAKTGFSFWPKNGPTDEYDVHAETMPAAISPPNENLPQIVDRPTWMLNALAGIDRPERPKIVIVIDDLGLNSKRAAQITKLPGPLTLAYLPYARKLPEQTKLARQNGHELMIHMPMQPLNNTVDPGPDALRADLSQQELTHRLKKNLSQFDGYVGINNHMGSAFTQDRKGLEIVMEILRERGLLYLDSRTSADSVAETVAREYRVATTGRDVFLDHVISAEFIAESLAKVEDIAERHGTVIAIGHPHPETAEALSHWLPTLERKGFQLVPLSHVMAERDPRVKAAVSDTAMLAKGEGKLRRPN